MDTAAQIIGVCVGPILAVYVIVVLRNERRQLVAIHELVNSRLTEALHEIRRLGGRDEDF